MILSRQVWFVTGASSGLGRCVVEYVLSKGDIVVATLRKPEALSDLTSQYDASQLLIVKLDVTKPEQITDAFAQTEAKFGRIDVVYNNAGYASLGEIEGTEDRIARGLFEVNFWGATNVARESVRFFRDVNKPAGGRLIQASSLAGFDAGAGLGYYSASKYAFEGISVALSKEIKPEWNIKMTILDLGLFKTRALSQDSLSTVPVHPAYIDAPTAAFRSLLSGGAIANKGADAAKAARQIYKIAEDKSVPLRVPLGIDAVARMNATLDAGKADVKKGARWSIDLAEEDSSE